MAFPTLAIYSSSWADTHIEDLCRSIERRAILRGWREGLLILDYRSGRECVLWMRLLESEAEMVSGVEELIVAVSRLRPAERAALAEWLTFQLLERPRRAGGLRHKFTKDFPTMSWQRAKEMASVLGFVDSDHPQGLVDGDLWRLPDDHPLMTLDSNEIACILAEHVVNEELRYRCPPSTFWAQRT